MTAENLYTRLEELGRDEFRQIEADFFLYFYKLPEERSAPFSNAFMILSSWLGTSLRDGVWTFYEAMPKSRIESAAEYLENAGEKELAVVLKSGIHSYDNPKYAGNYDYPEEWLTQSEEIDDWIYSHEEFLHSLMYDLLLENKGEVLN